jgi:membrane protease YdiL (CAAX protease family)
LLLGYLITPVITGLVLNVAFPGTPLLVQLTWMQATMSLMWVLLLVSLPRPHLPGLGLTLDKPFGFYVKYSLIAVAGLVGVIGLVSGLVTLFDVQPENPYADMPEAQLQVLQMFALAVAPFQEELVFRGLVQSTLHRYMRPLGAMVISSVVFTLLHIDYTHIVSALLYVVFLGLFLSWLREKTGSTVPGMVGHFVNNALVVVFSSYFNGIIRPL